MTSLWAHHPNEWRAHATVAPAILKTAGYESAGSQSCGYKHYILLFMDQPHTFNFDMRSVRGIFSYDS